MLLKEAEITAQHWSIALFLRFGCLLRGDTRDTLFSIRDLAFWKKMSKSTYAQRRYKADQFDFPTKKVRKRRRL